VDKANTAGWGKDTLVAFFTDTARSECIAYSTDGGETFTYYDKNPVLKHVGRDPYVFWYKYGDKDTPLNDEAKKLGGHWAMGVFEFDVERNKEMIGAFYTSTNMKDWTKQSRVTGIRECPNLIELPVDGDKSDRRWVLFGADALYQVGAFDGKAFTPEHEGKYQVHWGNYYASQVFNNTPDGRKIQIGWVNHVPAPGPYTQNFSFPTELTLHKTADGIRMFAAPIKEIETLRVKTNKADPQKLAAGQPLNLPVGSDLLDIRLTVEVGNAGTIELNVPGGPIKYDMKREELKLPKVKAVPLTPVGGKINLQVLIDRSLMDVAGNDGRVCINTLGPGKKVDVDKVSVTATGGDANLVVFEAHELKSIWNAAAR
jgi:fructan beta-fructosidase